MLNQKQLRAQQRFRLQEGGRINRDKPLKFTFAERILMGYEGDTLASALLANGVDIVGRSFKYGRPRGIMTAGVEEPNAIMQIGASEATQTPNIKATEQMLYDGLVCKPVNGWPNAENDKPTKNLSAKQPVWVAAPHSRTVIAMTTCIITPMS